MAKMGHLQCAQTIFLHKQLEKASYEIKQPDRDAYLDWYLEVFKRGE